MVGWANPCSVVEGYLKEARGNKFEDIYKMSMFHGGPAPSQDVLDSIREDKHVLIDWKPTLDLLMKTEYGKTKKCEYAIGIEEFYTERVALAFPIGNPWIEKFDERYAFGCNHWYYISRGALLDSRVLS